MIRSCSSDIATAHNVMINLYTTKMLVDSFIHNNLKRSKISRESFFCIIKLILTDKRVIDKELLVNS